MSLLMRVINDEAYTDKDIEDALYEICCAVHSGCYSACPVYAVSNRIPLDEELIECTCFKDGKAMLEYVRIVK